VIFVNKSFFFGIRKGKELKTPRHASAAASRDDRLPHSRQVECYGPYISSSGATGKRHEQTSDRSAGDAGTSRTMGRGVAESYNVTRLVRNVGT
jgi:hypothetical protein